MSDLEVKIGEYRSLHPTDYHVLSSLTLSNQIGPDGACEQVLSLLLQKEPDSSAGSLHLEFQGVRKLVFQQPKWSLISIGFLEVSLGREVTGVFGNLYVADKGHEEVVRFECRDFDAHIS